MLIALTRDISPAIGDCELTHLPRSPINVPRAREQHRAYEECLVRLGCQLLSLPGDPSLPDAVFVEDTCVVLDEVVVITRPGARSRRPETAAVAGVLKGFRPLHAIESPGTIDGGDVLVHGKTIYVGLSSRTNPEAVDQLRKLLHPLGYAVNTVTVQGCLHLKTAATLVADNTLLVNRAWVDVASLGDLPFIDVDPAEPFGGNALVISGVVLYPEAFPRTRQRLQQAGIEVLPIDLSELSKAEGGVTCCSVIFPR